MKNFEKFITGYSLRKINFVVITRNFMRKKIVAGNWKMHKTLEEGIFLAKEIILKLQTGNRKPETIVILCPPFVHLKSISEIINHQSSISNLHLCSQNCHWENQGAFTGEISPAMLKSVGVEYVIIGHSERRQFFQETNEMLAKKIIAVLKNNLRPIFCCGETLEQRNQNKQLHIVAQQLKESLFHLSKNEMEQVVIAYEPVWAIGTGLNATPEQAQEMHQYIRKLIAEQYNKELAENISILYGGSCKPDNAKSIFYQPDVDGGLIGGASLKADDFVKIIEAI